MVSCKNCSTLNSLDSAFCRRCGNAMAEEDISEAQSKLDRALSEGFEAFSKGKTDEAMMIADSAVASNPGSSRAHSLKAMCHERKGQYAEALDSYEAVLALDPDSTLDRLKVNQLKNLLVTSSKSSQPANARLALVGAIGAALLVVVVGAMAATLTSRKTDNSPTQTVAMNNAANSDSGYSAENFSNTDLQEPLANEPSASGDDQKPSGNSEDPAKPEINRGTSQPGGLTQIPPYKGTALPNPISGDIPPVQPSIRNLQVEPDEGNQPDSKAETETKSVDPAPPMEQPKQDRSSSISTGPKTSYIDIRTSRPTGAPDSNDSNGLEALVRTARSKFQNGDFKGAAGAYENALKLGADAAAVNQRLGQCYERLNRTADAIAAYNKAISSYEAQLASGGGNAQRIQAAITTCKQAVKVLQGD